MCLQYFHRVLKMKRSSSVQPNLHSHVLQIGIFVYDTAGWKWFINVHVVYFSSDNVDLFTFVLTSGDSKWTFGYCRHPPHAKKCTLFLTFLPWQEIFYRCLNLCAEAEPAALEQFLDKMYCSPVPEPGTCLYIPTMTKPFISPCPPDLGLSSIPENVRLLVCAICLFCTREIQVILYCLVSTEKCQRIL